MSGKERRTRKDKSSKYVKERKAKLKERWSSMNKEEKKKEETIRRRGIETIKRKKKISREELKEINKSIGTGGNKTLIKREPTTLETDKIARVYD